MEEFQRHIAANEPFAVAYADLDKFKAYNDVYGFEKGDEVIRETARILIHGVREVGGPNAFVGHVGGDDFVFIMDDKLIDRACQNIVDNFNKKIASFYSKKDFEAGYICGKDRRGNEERFGLLAISIGIVSNTSHEITHVAQISEIAAELKKYAKNIDGSNFVRDKRQN
jgi:diguanylate cyclase (GGDEF)-like protein